VSARHVGVKPAHEQHGAIGLSAHTDFLTAASIEKIRGQAEKIQGHEYYGRKRRNNHEHDLHRISSGHDSPLFLARRPLSYKRVHGCYFPMNAGCWSCVLESIQ
jgi:hypothetical protein